MRFLIQNKKTLTEFIKSEKRKNCSQGTIKQIYNAICHDRNTKSFQFLKFLRKTEYYGYKKSINKLYSLPFMFWYRKKNRLGNQLGLDIGCYSLDKGVTLAHTNIIVGSAKVGKNCILHGQNCIGSGAQIGDNCELWVGAKVFGPAKLANNITVAAGAIVLGEFLEEGITIGGVPARKIKDTLIKKVDYNDN